jgi:hypothetical protein
MDISHTTVYSTALMRWRGAGLGAHRYKCSMKPLYRVAAGAPGPVPLQPKRLTDLVSAAGEFKRCEVLSTGEVLPL